MKSLQIGEEIQKQVKSMILVIEKLNLSKNPPHLIELPNSNNNQTPEPDQNIIINEMINNEQNQYIS